MAEPDERKDNVLDEPPTLPNNAILEPERKLFRLRKFSGGTINKGAFGFHLPTTSSLSSSLQEDTVDPQQDLKNVVLDEASSSFLQESSEKTKSASTTTTDCASPWYLFLEEVIYLHERGLLEAYDAAERRLESRDLYRLLPDHQIPMPVFLVYAHLRQQTFRVVRYSAERRELIQEQLAATEKAVKARLSLQLRQVVASATLPPFSEVSSHLAWDVYPPDAPYQKREPGLPAFSVLVTLHAKPFYFDRIQTLIRDNEPIAIKLAAVADTGTVVIFGVTDIGAPSIATSREAHEQQTNADENTSIDDGIQEEEEDA